MSANNITLRACRYQDLKQLLSVEKASFAESAYGWADFVYFLARAKGGFIVACVDESLVGYVIAMENGANGMIESIAVSPELRGRGIGKLLMKSALDHLAKCDRIYLLVDSENTPAISLYDNFSFKETGKIIEGYYRNGHDAVEMVRVKVIRKTN